jgi:hypothetical protein
MNQIDKNDVPAAAQLHEISHVSYVNSEGKGLRVLVVGNSITLHEAKPEIGWYNSFGMAASAKERDYVHLLMGKIAAAYPDAAFCIAQVAQWEQQYANGSAVLPQYAAARDFGADVIIMRCIENCHNRTLDPMVLKREYSKLVDFLKSNPAAKVILTTGFWKHYGDGVIRAIGEERGYPVVELGDLGELDEMKAIGLFEHKGVANHPGDKGMQVIADRIWEVIRNETI